MTPLLIAALIAVNVAYLLLLDRRDKRHTTSLDALNGLIEREARAYREAQQQQTIAFLSVIERERDAKRDELQMLCQRIQAPEIAVIQHQQQGVPDENPYPLTEEESVEAQEEKMRLIAEIERMERDGVALHFPGVEG